MSPRKTFHMRVKLVNLVTALVLHQGINTLEMAKVFRKTIKLFGQVASRKAVTYPSHQNAKLHQ